MATIGGHRIALRPSYRTGLGSGDPLLALAHEA
jgi:hypothetical protein